MTTTTEVPATAPTPAVRHPLPGRGLGIAGFILSMLGVLSPAGLVLSLVALIRSRRAGGRNGLASAGVALGVLGTVVVVVVAITAVTELSSQPAVCSIGDLIRLGCPDLD